MKKWLKRIDTSLIKLPTPSSISINWNWGSILGVILGIQILRGVLVSLYYVGSVELAFEAVNLITRDVSGGWLRRRVHANGANLFFLLIYLHRGRGRYYYSWLNKQVWGVGVLIFFILRATAFLGYVLPWGQISYWGATVITNLISSIPYVGKDLVCWVWGGFAVAGPTLSRFYSFHFYLPIRLVVLAIFHLIFLHEEGRRNPIKIPSGVDTLPFHPYFRLKDRVGFMGLFILLRSISIYSPSFLRDPDNFRKANSLVTPKHIQPEWYFLFAYAILRSIPRKLGGVVALFLSIGILLTPLVVNYSSLVFSKERRRIMKFNFWSLISVFLMLTWLGGRPVEYPYERLRQIFTRRYFLRIGVEFSKLKWIN